MAEMKRPASEFERLSKIEALKEASRQDWIANSVRCTESWLREGYSQADIEVFLSRSSLDYTVAEMEQIYNEALKRKKQKEN